MKTARQIFLTLTLLLPLMVLVGGGALAKGKLEATIFSYDGTDFVRTETTLKAEGKSAADTKLDQSSPAYKALAAGHSFTGPTTLFGQDYQSYYAPLTGEDGGVTGAIFVGVPK